MVPLEGDVNLGGLMLTVGMALVFIGLLGALLFSSLTVKSGTDLRKNSADLSKGISKIGVNLSLTVGFGGISLIGLALVLVAGFGAV